MYRSTSASQNRICMFTPCRAPSARTSARLRRRVRVRASRITGSYDVPFGQRVPEPDLHVHAVSRPFGTHRGLQPDGGVVVSQPGQRHGYPLDFKTRLEAVPDGLGKHETLAIETKTFEAAAGDQRAVREIVEAGVLRPPVADLAGERDDFVRDGARLIDAREGDE